MVDEVHACCMEPEKEVITHLNVSLPSSETKKPGSLSNTGFFHDPEVPR